MYLFASNSVFTVYKNKTISKFSRPRKIYWFWGFAYNLMDSGKFVLIVISFTFIFFPSIFVFFFCHPKLNRS